MKSVLGLLDLKEGTLVYLDKPLGWSSFQLLNKFRLLASRHLGVKRLKVGHAGTLDPLATGVMILATGKKTKQIEALQKGVKEYIATIRLGASTPSYDLETEVDEVAPYEHITTEAILEVLSHWHGEVDQVPPIFSAVKVDGKRAYKLARKGRDVALEPKKVKIYEIELLEDSLPEIKLRVVCGKGTYIRSLARDIALDLGSLGHLVALERTRVGEALLEDCLKIEDIALWLDEHVERNIGLDKKDN